MSKKATTQPIELKRSTLRMLRTEAGQRIQAQIEKGEELRKIRLENRDDLEKANGQKRDWSEYNRDLLRRVIDTDDLVNDYVRNIGFGGVDTLSLQAEIDQFVSDLTDKVRRLRSILARLELIPESPTLVDSSHQEPEISRKANNQVFIVHGHDEEAKLAVKLLLTRLSLTPIILQDQPKQNRTIIEAFEDHASDANFAVVLLTPDDQGTSKKNFELKPRARQNVILELGFFMGKLGRSRVCALHKGDIEQPSDISGLFWLDMDSSNAWQLLLAKEMKKAGLDVDMNRL